MSVKDTINSSKLLGLKGAFAIYCKYICNNRVKIWFVGDKYLRVGFPLMPYFCKDCDKLNPKIKELYKKWGKWYPV